MRHRGLCPVQRSAAGFGAAAVLLFGLCGAATWGGFDPVARTIEAALGALAGAGALICWAVRYRRDADRQEREADRQERALLIRTLAGVLPAERRELAKTLPIRAR